MLRNKDSPIISKEEREKISSQVAKPLLHIKGETMEISNVTAFLNFLIEKLPESSCIISLAMLSY